MREVGTLPRTRGAAVDRGLVVVVALGVSGGASLPHLQQPMSSRGAAREAVVAVCGDRRGADSACVVRGVERAGRGYHVLLARRPASGLTPADDDHLSVTIQPSGVLGGWAVDVRPHAP